MDLTDDIGYGREAGYVPVRGTVEGGLEEQPTYLKVRSVIWKKEEKGYRM